MPAHAVGVAVSVLLTSDIDRRGLGTFSAANSASSPGRVIGDIGAGDDTTFKPCYTVWLG